MCSCAHKKSNLPQCGRLYYRFFIDKKETVTLCKSALNCEDY